MKRVHLIIRGDIQGVSFRAWTLRQGFDGELSRTAQGLQLTGWVKNRTDGSVELVAEGPQDKLGELVKRCQRGPEMAWVEKVEVNWSEATGEFFQFTVVL